MKRIDWFFVFEHFVSFSLPSFFCILIFLSWFMIDKAFFFLSSQEELDLLGAQNLDQIDNPLVWMNAADEWWLN